MDHSPGSATSSLHMYRIKNYMGSKHKLLMDFKTILREVECSGIICQINEDEPSPENECNIIWTNKRDALKKLFI